MVDLFGQEEEAQKTSRNGRGGGKSVLRMIGASNHSAFARANEDYYATDPRAVEMLCDLEKFNKNILEPSCGEGHISKVLEARGYEVESRDLVYRGYGKGGCDFLLGMEERWDGDIVMNPPYEYAEEFVRKSLYSVVEGGKVAAFLKLTFAEGNKRREFFKEFPPCRVWVSSKRIECAKNGQFTGASAVCYAWWIWIKGHNGATEMRWFN